ncbi:hypothetical protein CBP51_00260 [Cellvibrio mixtus]|uniref:DUF4124 domain-containing protein n=1 Tax=Cellvibrio mixtus TaxID=39650 RepID=A0A266Q816_9GAMM|nr:DUF4124 domain-containing protein [Cellvibrio mixtus]OZY85521.1 hypothetical protein CBP51_00260 [Cellvibrio mixtus]
MKTGVLVLAICMVQNCFAADIYKCIDAQGKHIFSDKQCPKNTSQEHIKHKNEIFEDQLIGLASGHSKVTNITKDGDDTLVDYQFGTQAELQAFMRASMKLSGKNVNLLKVAMPHGGSKGQAKLQITDKDNGLFRAAPNK